MLSSHVRNALTHAVSISFRLLFSDVYEHVPTVALQFFSICAG
uniref:Uncharacterized protein n=1 Tax=Arundo donax TaxID=35708 RepID=A0A0A8ZMF3_ARUDO